MNRKLIQMGESSLLVSLPSNWIKSKKLSKGDEVHLQEEDGNILVKHKEGSGNNEEISIDVTDLDRTYTTIAIRAAYRKGYDTIVIHYRKEKTMHHRLQEKKSYQRIIREEAQRLTGFEIMQEEDNKTVLKEVSEATPKGLDAMVRRIFRLVIDLMETSINTDPQKRIVDEIDQKHDSVVKMLSYCLRIMNKKKAITERNKTSFYHVLNSVDLISDILKYAAKEFYREKAVLTNDALSFFKEIQDNFQLFYETFYNFKFDKIDVLSAREEATKNHIMNNLKLLTKEEVLFITRISIITEITVRDIIEARMAMSYQE